MHRVFSALERPDIWPIQLTGKAHADKITQELDAILERIQLVNPIGDPDYVWIDEDQGGKGHWPPVSEDNLVAWLGDHDNLQSYRTKKSYGYAYRGWLHPVKYSGISVTNENCLLMSRHERSMVPGDPYTVWVALNKETGVVQGAYCTCFAGVSERCAHVCGVLFKTNHVYEIGEGACTASTASWPLPRDPATKATPFQRPDVRVTDPVVEVVTGFSKVEYKVKKLRPMFSKERYEFTPLGSAVRKGRLRRTTIEEFKTWAEENCQDSAFSQSFSGKPPQKAASSGPARKASTIQPAAASAFKEKAPSLLRLAGLYKMDSEKRQLTLSGTEFTRIFVPNFFRSWDGDLIAQIEADTRGQATSASWLGQRYGRITASKFYSVTTKTETLQAKGEANCEYLLKTLMPSGPTFTSEDMKYGSLHEEDARKAYQQYMESQGHILTVQPCGLFVSTESPVLGASPDGLVHCECCGEGLVEIKCPAKLKDVIPTQDNIDFLAKRSGELKRRHAYFFQMQGQMAITDRKWCDLAVWSAHGLYMKRLDFDSAFWEDTSRKLNLFYEQIVAPVILFGKDYFAQPMKFLHPKPCDQTEGDAAAAASDDEATERQPATCAVCRKAIESNLAVLGIEQLTGDHFAARSIQCDSCQQLVHFGCAGFHTVDDVPGDEFVCSCCLDKARQKLFRR